MKMFTNLPGTLRALFGFMRIMTVVMAVFWLLTLAYNAWIQDRFGHASGLIATVGQISLPAAVGAIGLSSDTANPGALKLSSLCGTLQVDLCSNDAGLVSALRWSIIPAMTALIVFSYIVFSSLRNVCSNLERGDVFNDGNLRNVRRIGASLVAYSLVGAALEFWSSHVLGGYFGQHVVLTGLKSTFPFPNGSGALHFFNFPSGLLTTQGEFLVGWLVLAASEAFRQGLELKAENDLTV
jgi:hypothetical protein